MLIWQIKWGDSVGKRYWWLKLQEDFFRQVEIKKLRKIAGGDTYTVIYLKMMLLSLKNEGHIAYDCPESEFIENLALDIDEDEENVSVTVAFLRKHNLLVESEFESDVSLPKAAEAIGSETAVAERVRRHREKMKALQCNTDVTPMKQIGNGEKEQEKEQEKDLELDNNNNNTKSNFSNVIVNANDNDVSYHDSYHDSSNVPLGSQEVVVGAVSKPSVFWNKNMGLMTEYISEKIRDMIAVYGEVVVLEAMQRSLEQGKRTLAYVEGCCKNIHSGADKPKREELLF